MTRWCLNSGAYEFHGQAHDSLIFGTQCIPLKLHFRGKAQKTSHVLCWILSVLKMKKRNMKNVKIKINIKDWNIWEESNFLLTLLWKQLALDLQI